MKNLIKVTLASAVIGAMAIVSTGCLGIPGLSGFGGGSKYVDETDDIIEDCMNFKTKQLAKHLNEDDDNFDNNEEILETALSNLSDYVDYGDFMEDVKCTGKNIDVDDDELDITYTFEFNDEEFELSFKMIDDDGELIFEDNKDFIISYLDLALSLALENDDDYANALLDEMGCKESKLAERCYENWDLLLTVGDF